MWIETLTAILSLCAALGLPIGYAIYYHHLWHENSKPKKASWALWAYLTVINAGTYLDAGEDLIKSLTSLTEGIACIVTCILVFLRGEKKPLSSLEKCVVASSLVVSIVWALLRDPLTANLVLQFCIVLSCWPVVDGLWKQPKNEPSLPWLIWSGVYLLNLVVICLRWRGNWEDLVYPLNYLILHLSIFLLSIRKPSLAVN